MKIDRRSFLSFVIGGAAGTALSPLPYKLTDDLSIWSQNWPWTPVPPDGEASFVNSTCTLCPGHCGITVKKIDDRAIKIEGQKQHPVNDGAICLLGLSGLQLLYGPTRVTGPMKRTGQRGSGQWRSISWAEALATVAGKLGELRKGGQPQALGCLLGPDRGTVSQLFARFMTAFGSPNLFKTVSARDSYELTLYLTQGVQASAGYDLEKADFILSFGSGLVEGWGSPVRMFRINSRRSENRGRLIQIEPRLSNTAAKADKWIPVVPGTEGILALGLAHVIVKESLYNKDFVERHTSGFDDWTDSRGNPHSGFQRLLMEHYAPDQVAKATGIDPATITAVARGFARASKPLAVCGRGQGDTPGAIGDFLAVHALNALVGNLNRAGGLWALPEPAYFDWPEPEMDAIAAAGMQKDRVDGAGSAKFPYSRYLLNRLAASGAAEALKVLFVSGANPLYTQPDNASLKKALAGIPFIVSFSSYMDETTAQADLVLPNHTYLERYEDVDAPSGYPQPFIGLTRPVVAPQFDTRHVGDVIIQLAKAVGGNVGRAFPWQDYMNCLQKTLGSRWKGLVENGYWVDSDYTPPVWERAFETPSKKFEFFPTALADEARKAPEILPGLAKFDLDGDPSTYPLVLIPYDTMRLANDVIGNPPFATKTLEDTILKGQTVFIEVNPATARELKLSEGSEALLSTPRGVATVKVHLFDGIMPGLLAMPRGLGHTAKDRYLAGKGLNFNEIVAALDDPVSGQNVAWGVRASLRRA